METLEKIKLRLGVVYTDPLKDAELSGRIEACKADLMAAGVPESALASELAVDTIERYLQGLQNDPVYIANTIKLRGAT